jgi:hypothetical protein
MRKNYPFLKASSAAGLGGLQCPHRSSELLEARSHRLELLPIHAVARAHALYFATDEARVFEFFEVL